MPRRHTGQPYLPYSDATHRLTQPGKDMPKHKKISKTEEKHLLALTHTMGDRITQAMEDQGLSISWLANKMTVVDRTVSDWRKDGNVSTHRIPLLAQYLNQTVEYLMTGEEAHPFQRITEDDNVVQLERNIEPNLSLSSIGSVIRYVGIYELDEVRDAVKVDPWSWLETVRRFAKQPAERTCLGISLNKDKLDQPGIPHFVLQYLIDGPSIKRGTYLGYASDIAPARGKFCIFAMKKKGAEYFNFANGYYYPVNNRLLATTSMGDEYQNQNQGFVLQLHPHEPSVDDVFCMPDDFVDWEKDCRVLGVATWQTQWLDELGMKHHTGIFERLDRIYEGRRIRPQKGFGEQ